MKTNNKDGVLFPERINGYYFLLHRPWGDKVGSLSDFHTRLARSDTPTGFWEDCGIVMKAYDIPDCSDSWNGAGSVPIPLGNKRYLIIYHTGNWHKNGEKEYDLDAAIFDFNKFSLASPESIVESRIEPLMVPDSNYETQSPLADSETKYAIHLWNLCLSGAYLPYLWRRGYLHYGSKSKNEGLAGIFKELEKRQSIY